MMDVRKQFGKIRKHYRALISLTGNHYFIGIVNEWIVDNYHIVVEQYKDVLKFISDKRLYQHSYKNIDVFNFVNKTLEKYNYKIDEVILTHEINRYQKESQYNFTYEELSVIPEVIKTVLLKKISLICIEEDIKIKERDEINRIIERIKIALLNNNQVSLKKMIKIADRSNNFIVYFNEQLKELERNSNAIFKQLNELLNTNGRVLKDIINSEHMVNANVSITIKNIFYTLNRAQVINDEELFDELNNVEKILKKDKYYKMMTSETKKTYRKILLKRAEKLKVDPFTYVSKLLNDKEDLSSAVSINRENKTKQYLYIFFVCFMTILISYCLSGLLTSYMVIGFIVLLVPISEIIIAATNKVLMKFNPTIPIPKLDFSDGIPNNCKTMVVMPTIVKDAKRIKQCFDNLEAYYISSKTKNVYFTLLGDCFANNEEFHEKDKEIVEAGQRIASELNQKYGENIFYFAYRRRKYNKGEEAWLGFERKRGALLHFNELLLGHLSESDQKELFLTHTFINFKEKIKYVITLDVDTRLLPNSVAKLVGAMAHPANKPILNKHNKVVKGYAIMQPNVSIDVDSTNKSLFSQIYGGIGGFDPYNCIYPHFYQDVFKEGSFIGKGIYDLQVYQAVLMNRFPNNLILSHDLLEGSYLRCANVTDIELVDDFPHRFLVDAARRSRWARGDMQIVGWLRSKIKHGRAKNPISPISKWKMFDNIRRGFLELSLTLILIIAFISNNVNPAWWVSFVIFICFMPVLVHIVRQILVIRTNSASLKYYNTLVFGNRSFILRTFSVLSTLPYNAYLYMNSFSKSLYRMFISKKKLLNWMTAEEAEKVISTKFLTAIKQFWPNYLMATLLIIITIFIPNNIILILSLIVLFLIAPVVAYLISEELDVKEEKIDEEDRDFLQDLANKTWHFYADHLTKENNYLIPDNYQLNRDIREDMKTSPTNIGFSLLAIVSANELGFIKEKEAYKLIANILETIRKLEKWNGHLFNWYNIKTLKVMWPSFVSSVDSGNYVASLIVTKEFLFKHNFNDLAVDIEEMIKQTNFRSLYLDNDIFSIGYNADEGRLSPYYYDKLMSETRILSYVAIAKGDVPSKHWLSLDKTLINYKFKKGMASWSGTFFEYYMPLIFMKSYENTLLDESYDFAYCVERDFMKEIDADYPWGISESAYNKQDDDQNYQYKAFGLPQLKIREEFPDRIVISPYSSALAITKYPEEVINNLKRFTKLDMFGKYGLYESYDDEDKTPVYAYFAHHQGMILTSLTNYLTGGIIQNYFENDKNNNAYQILNKEKVQFKPHINLDILRYKKYTYEKEPLVNDIRVFRYISTLPELSVLSNSKYSVIINDRGNGFSSYYNIQLNRFRKVTEQDYGLFLYIKDLKTSKVWSNTYAPINVKPSKYEVVFALDQIKFIRTDNDIITTTEIVVTRNHNAEIRRITFKNNSNKNRDLELTTYTEPILCNNNDDISHRTFSNLFVYSEYDDDTNSIIVKRKAKDNQNDRYMINRLIIDEPLDEFEYETNRDNFIGRNNNGTNPIALNKKLTNNVGTTLDPIISLRNKIRVPKNGEKIVYIVSGFGKSREQVIDIVKTYDNYQTISEFGFQTSTIINNVSNKMVNISGNDMRLYNTILNYLLQTSNISLTEDDKKNLAANTLNRTDLWRFGISGDLPIILLDIKSLDDLSLIKEVLHAFEYYKARSILVDLLIINNVDEKEAKVIEKEIEDEKYHMYAINNFEKLPGNIYVLNRNELSEQDIVLFKAVARLKIDSSLFNSLQEYIYELQKLNTIDRREMIKRSPDIKVLPLKEKMKFFNEFGGFINNGKEYLVINKNTPTAWSNVIANKHFGTIVTNNGCGFTYAFNSREYKLTNWTNDPLISDYSEGFRINDISLDFANFVVGFGYSDLYSRIKNVDVNVKEFVARDDTIKFYKFKFKNNGARKQKINLAYWINPCLGVTEEKTSRHILTEYNKEDNYLAIKNNCTKNFNDVKTFISSDLKINNVVTDSILFREIGVSFYLEAKEEKELCFMLGAGTDDVIKGYLNKYGELKNVTKELSNVLKYWQDQLSVISVKTPDESLNYMLNGWLLYQAITSRIYAKAGFYQVSGGIGFRDQLQDAMNICAVDSRLTKEQIILHAKHQFITGDVLHWWHDETYEGIRTLYKDDYLWLIHAVYDYVKVTGDNTLLDELVPFATGPSLELNEHEKVITYAFTDDYKTIYEHCEIAINRAMNDLGKNGLPLMGGGDWNDGMNKVGIKGEGTSVWLGFFLYQMTEMFINLTKNYKKEISVDKYLAFNKELKSSILNNAWDGKYFARAFFDNGNILGSHINKECSIDLISQSYAILTGIADAKQSKDIFNAVEEHLVDHNLKIIKLLDPAFDKSDDNPGYIMDYPKGIRENGGQYTHSVAWYIMALIKLGKNDLAYQYYQMLNPINRTLTKESAIKYRVEPYVIAADIYSNESFAGRGGWTWYTGSAGWFYRVGIENILGFNLNGDKLYIKPNVPSNWMGYKMSYRYKETTYNIEILLDQHSSGIIVDNIEIKEDYVPLVNDLKEHKVIIKIS